MSFRRDVWRIDRAGSLDRLTRRTEALGDPAPGEVRVAVKAIGLNFADIFACLGLYSATPAGTFIPGLEFSGIVERVGPPVSGAGDAPVIREGDAVIGMTRFGGYATAINAGRQYLRPMPTGWTFAQAAAYPVQALTAWYGLVRLGALAPGHVVLLQSAAGGVGLNALAILQAHGARTIATVGREEKRQWLIAHRGLPPETVLVRNRRTFGADLDRALLRFSAGRCGVPEARPERAPRVRPTPADSRQAASGFDLVFDAVAGPFFRPAYDRVRPEGRLVVYGAADFMTRGPRANYLRLALRYLRRPRIDPLAMVSDNRSVMGFNLIWLWDRADQLMGAFDELESLITAPPLVGRTAPFAEAPAALRYLQSGESIGKVVLET